MKKAFLPRVSSGQGSTAVPPSGVAGHRIPLSRVSLQNGVESAVVSGADVGTVSCGETLAESAIDPNILVAIK